MSDNWLQLALNEAIRKNACMKIVCTTCGGAPMRALLFGITNPSGPYGSSDPPLTLERAREVAEALSGCLPDRGEPYEFVEGVRSLLYAIWLQFGDAAHSQIFPTLEGTWAGSVLSEMKRHYEQRTLARRRHEERQGVKKRDWKD